MTFPVLLLSVVFFCSGLSSLVYQIVWQRLLTVHYGVGAVSITLIVTVYMLGLGLGAMFGGQVAARIKRPLVLYLSIELGLGAFGLVSIPLLQWIGASTAGSDHAIALAWMFLFLCVPTVLMGMTLPLVVQILCAWLHDFRRTVSFLYFINTLGASAGALIASYVLISFFGMDAAVSTAAALNLSIAAAVFVLTRYAEPPTQATATTVEQDGESLGRLALLTVFATGFLALGYEIIWMRLVGVLIKDSPYSFSTVLAIYLFGVAIGSYCMERLLRARPAIRLRELLFTMQAILAAYIVTSIAAFPWLIRSTPVGMLARASFASDVHPRLPDPEAGISALAALWSFADAFVWPAFFVLVPTMIMGASFPLLSLLSGRSDGREGRIVGNLYFWNIMGNAAGGLATGFLLLPALGSERTLLLFAAVGFAFLLPARRLFGRDLGPLQRVGIVAASLLLSVGLMPGRGQLYPLMHVAPLPNAKSYFAEGVEGIVLTYVDGERVQHYIGGQAHGGRPGPIFYHESIEALSFSGSPRHILVIGYGTGSTVETALRTPGVESVTLVELNATVMRNLQRIPLFESLLADPRIKLILEDGRRYLLRSDQRFDAILIDPLRTATAYSGNIYSLEFFELIARHLGEHAPALIWLDEHRILPATLLRAFPHVRKYGVFALASNEPFPNRNENRRTAILERLPEPLRAAIDALEGGFEGDETALGGRLGGSAVNRDVFPVTEYYLGYQTRRWLHGQAASAR